MQYQDIKPRTGSQFVRLLFGRAYKGARAMQAALKEQRDTELALAELRKFSDAQLADIGLSRTCLTLDGLKAAAERRARLPDLGPIHPTTAAHRR